MVNQGYHHLHKRKRVYQRGLEPYPSPSRWKRLVDKMIYVVIFVGPVMTIPQVFEIWVNKNVGGVSVISWLAYAFVSVFWLAYGLIHKEKPIILSSIAWIVLNLLVVAGVLLHG